MAHVARELPAEAPAAHAADAADEVPDLHLLTVWEMLKRDMCASTSLTVRDDAMHAMNVLFERLLSAALEIVDKGWVHRVVTPSGRTLSVVKGKSASQYVVVGDYCPCPYFANNVASGDALWCKHIIAVQLRDCLRPQLQPQEISEAEFVGYVCAPPAAAATGTTSPSKR